MTLPYIDTNLIIRYLTRDHPEMATRAKQVLNRVATGTLIVTTTEGVIIEAVHILSSKALYHLARSEVVSRLAPILRLRGLRLRGKRTYLRALELYEQINIDFVDCLIVAKMEQTHSTTIISFDMHFDRVPGITRQEPG